MVGRLAALAVGALMALTGMARAEVTEVRFSKQHGLGYLTMIIIESQKLIEKHAKSAGLGDVNVVWMQHAGPSVQLDALFAGQVDFIGPGVPTLLTIWDRTSGTPQEVRALSALQSMPYVLVTRNPNVKTIADFTESDKIALPGVKLTGHALALEMAAAKLWGFENYDKLDALTITRSHSDAAAALLSGMSEINSHFASSPFYYYELAKPGIRQVLKSYDVLGGKHTNGVLLASKRFYDANPKICAAVLAAFDEANAFAKGNPRAAAEVYLAATKDKEPLDSLEKMVADPDVDYTTTPVNVMAFAEFMHKVGRIKKKPASWKDLFFTQAQSLNGS
jgi:NitT/TauT family transport system substrate-binding protein